MVSEGFHGDRSIVPNACGCAWQQHIQIGDDIRQFCRGEKLIYNDDGSHALDEHGFWKREPCDCTAVAPRHYQRRIIGADIVCNCGWDPMSCKPGETWDEHEDRSVTI